jgi:hypothetical protein
MTVRPKLSRRARHCRCSHTTPPDTIVVRAYLY